MANPKTWLSAIARPNAVYIQAYIFGVDYGYVNNKSLILTNLATNVAVEYEMSIGSDGICLFKNNQKINPTLSSMFKLELKLEVYDYTTNTLIDFVYAVEFTTPTAWTSVSGTQFDLIATKEILPGKTSVEPNIRVAINGGDIPINSILRICGGNSLSNIVEFNSFDAMKEFILDGTQVLFDNTFKLNVSGAWNFKVFLKLPNGEITTSELITHIVNQGDVLITNITEEDNILKLQTGQPFNLNQIIGTKRVGITTINAEQTIQKGSFYHFANNTGQWYFEFRDNLKATPYRLPSRDELEAYAAIKSTLIGGSSIVYFSSEETEPGSSNVKAWSFNSGAPTTAYAGDNNVGYLILEDFENNIATADPLVIPVFNGGLNIQPSGIKITELVKNSDLKGYINVNALANPIKLWSITVDPELGYDNAEIPNYDPYRRFFYYNEAEKMLYYRWIEMTPGAWLPYQAPSTDAIYTFNGDKYMWNGTNLVNINLGSSNISLDNFEEANY